MRRREFITLLGGGAAAAWPFGAVAQQDGRIRHVMIWIGGSGSDPTSQQRAVAFRDSMRGLGWIDGRNVKIDVRFSNRPFRVKRFQTIHHYSVDVAHGLVRLYGIGTKALPSWDSKTGGTIFRAALSSV